MAYVAQGGDAAGTIAALSGQAQLEQQLQTTKAQLAHEASIIASLRVKEGEFKTTALAAGKSVVRVKMQQLDGEGEPAAEEGAEEGDMTRQKVHRFKVTFTFKHNQTPV